MGVLNQNQQQKISKVPETADEWSFSRVAEGITINVVSAFFIAIGAILLGAIYSIWVLLLTLWNLPGGIIASLALILLGAILGVMFLVIAGIAWLRGTKSPLVMGMVFGALIGAAIGAAMDSKKDRFTADEAVTKAQEEMNQKETKREKV